jgi:predicted negative regulator of RcsB-dependent stress response
VAVAEDALTLKTETLHTGPQDTNSMTWPMLPGENLNEVARLFYPKNKALQQRFIFKTLRLSAEIQPNLKASDRFETPTLLVIPTLKSLSNSTRAIKSGQIKSNTQKLKMSYDIEQIPARLIQEYELLLSKNAFLKEELARLNEKLVFLQAKLNELKLILDKTLNLSNVPLPNANVANSDAAKSSTPAFLPTDAQPAKKVFKNLNQPAEVKPEATSSWLNSLIERLNNNLYLVILGLCLVTVIGVYLFKKYQRKVVDNVTFVATKMQASVADLGEYFQATKALTNPLTQQNNTAKGPNTRVDATLEDAKLLMSINRHDDAIAHLKMTIESQPKASINHWLYLLEIFRKLNLQAEFEQYAEQMHQTFNIITPVWYGTEVAIHVPQSLEEFPHIMERLYGSWPDDAAAYLRNLLIDNRGGERSGFGEAVISEITTLIDVLSARRELV